jgi:hypothetical protein
MGLRKGGPTAHLNEIPPFPKSGVRLIKEDEHVAIWVEVFAPAKPTPPHRLLRDYIAIFGVRASAVPPGLSW